MKKHLISHEPKVVSLPDEKFSFKNLLKDIFLTEIISGLGLTLSSLFKKPVTKQYPHEKKEAKQGFRGLHALARRPDTGLAKCVGCGLCAAICPSKCITIYTYEDVNHDKIVDRYELDILRCVFCSFCVEACPYGAIVMTRHYEYASYSKEALFMTKEKLLKNWDDYMSDEDALVYFKKYWGPREEDFVGHEGQAVFRNNK
ncbi:MAG: NADH-quinone oxidoreductase subunit NuoI [Nitrospirae bacterium]|nr:NADH-quinone oxidoreductase subunit NuoI [Nitrospirota bacterium]MBF0540089.1 NADH-quinone oxidoreductase subunit NuoI [Nitrospirota bacterium]